MTDPRSFLVECTSLVTGEVVDTIEVLAYDTSQARVNAIRVMQHQPGYDWTYLDYRVLQPTASEG